MRVIFCQYKVHLTLQFIGQDRIEAGTPSRCLAPNIRLSRSRSSDRLTVRCGVDSVPGRSSRVVKIQRLAVIIYGNPVDPHYIDVGRTNAHIVTGEIS